jgi:ketosteroid isomerase-like protein
LTRLENAVAVCGFAIALVLCSTAPSSAGRALEVASLHAADDAWAKAYNAGQVDNVVDLYDENSVIYPLGGTPVHGRAAIRVFFERDMGDFAKTGLAFVLGPKPDGGVSGDMGWSSGNWTLKDKSGQIVDAGWYFSVSRKVGGTWLYVRDAWNSDKPSTPATTSEK